VLDPESLIRVLRARAKTIHQRQSEEVIEFKTIGRYPPAFGLMGTTLSMITLLQRMGQPGAQSQLGPAMALGLVATFYGLVLAFLVINPIAESLAKTTRRHWIRHVVIVEGVRLILARTNPLVLAEELNSYLLPGERIDWKLGAAKAAEDRAA
jgi:chemotaxis protein MotA